MHPGIAEEQLAQLLERYLARDLSEARLLEYLKGLDDLGRLDDRDQPLHVTGSALVLDDAGRVLLRWHHRLSAWLQVGGHVESEDASPFRTAWREASEETGISDLRLWPADEVLQPVQLVIVEVPASRREPAHEHLDIRYLLRTDSPQSTLAESPDNPLRWEEIDAALALVEEENFRVFLQRVQAIVTLLEPGAAERSGPGN